MSNTATEIVAGIAGGALAVPPLTNDEIEAIARPISMADLLDAWRTALLGGELEVADKLRWLIDGRHALIEAWAHGSSITRNAIHGRKVS